MPPWIPRWPRRLVVEEIRKGATTVYLLESGTGRQPASGLYNCSIIETSPVVLPGLAGADATKKLYHVKMGADLVELTSVSKTEFFHQEGKTQKEIGYMRVLPKQHSLITAAGLQVGQLQSFCCSLRFSISTPVTFLYNISSCAAEDRVAGPLAQLHS